MKIKGWERIYKEKGELFSEVEPKIKKLAGIFKKKGYSKVLDLGCGTGRHSLFLANNGFFVYAIDISKTGIEILKRNAKKQGLKNISYKLHNITKIPYPNNFFDALICVFAMGHGTLSDAKKTINEIYRVLKPKGMVVTEFMSIKDKTYGKGKKIEKNTFIGSMEGEEEIPHHYFSKNELEVLFYKFNKKKITATIYFNKIKAFDVEAIK